MRVPFSRSVLKALYERAILKDIRRENWIFSDLRLKLIFAEHLDWERYYCPVDVRGKVVLDVGAGEGETARFYIKRGARKVFCVEPCPFSYKKLLVNSKRFPQIVPVNSVFDVDMLRLPFDFLKVDIEGYEEALLGQKIVKPTFLEIHGLQLKDKFEKEGFRTLHPHFYLDEGFGYGSLTYGYKNCDVPKN